jgi:hypothetical protein
MTIYVIARNAQLAERHAAAAPRVWFTDEQAAVDECNAIRDEELRRDFQIYAVEDGPGESGKLAKVIDRIGEAAAIPSLMLCGWLVWLILPGPAWASFEQHHAPASAFDFASIWLAMGIFIAAAVTGLGAFLANAMRSRINHDFTGEHTNGND